MIELLNGLHETVVHQKGFDFYMHDNDEFVAYPSHWHTELEIIMPIIGSYEAAIGKNDYLLREGDILLIGSGVLHTLNAPEPGRRLILQPGFPLLHSINGLDSLLATLPPSLLITKERYPDIQPRLYEIITTIWDEYFSKQVLKEASICALLVEMFVLLGRHNANQTFEADVTIDKKNEYSEKFNNVCTYVSDHLSEELDLETIASMAGFSKYHFTRLFKQFSGYSFYRYVNHKRIEYAQMLLADPDMTITDAAMKSGFPSISAFIRMFKQINGCTPSEFRTMYWGYNT